MLSRSLPLAGRTARILRCLPRQAVASPNTSGGVVDLPTAAAAAAATTTSTRLFSSSAAESTATAAQDKERAAQRVRDELSEKKGRAWTDPWDLEDMMMSKLEYDTMPDWSPDLVSRISQERVQIHPDKIPNLSQLAQLPLPRPPPPHPAVQGKLYALHRKRVHYQHILKQVKTLAEPKIGAIQTLTDWHDKQDAVDQLFEDIEFALKEKESILGKHPNFGTWVERALEEYLKSVQTSSPLNNSGDAVDAVSADKDKPSNKGADADAVPIFMDCFGAEDQEDQPVPNILAPLSTKTDGAVGTMVEEWELSAHKTSRRIMLRQCTRKMAQALLAVQADGTSSSSSSPPRRIVITGAEGVGKTAALNALVASARTSGYVVLYMPQGDQFHQNGYYVEPNPYKKGIFDLPVLSQTVCGQFLSSHEKDLEQFKIGKDVLNQHFTQEQMERLFRDSPDDDEKSLSLVSLLKYGVEKTSYAGSCYAAAVDFMMYHQDAVPFLIAADEFNCFYKATGHYFHMDYDENVHKSIPYDQISLFKPAMDAMALSASDTTEEDAVPPAEPKAMKHSLGGVVVAFTESHAVPRAVTDALTAFAVQDKSLTHCAVPRLSAIEVEHMLANYEATGVGKLRLDRGETVMNDQEVAYLRMVSGGVAQHLMNASMI